MARKSAKHSWKSNDPTRGKKPKRIHGAGTRAASGINFQKTLWTSDDQRGAMSKSGRLPGISSKLPTIASDKTGPRPSVSGKSAAVSARQPKKRSTSGSFAPSNVGATGQVYLRNNTRSSSKGFHPTHALSAVASAVRGLFAKSAALRIVSVVIAAVLVFTAVDIFVNNGKIYPGIKVGGIDVGGMTVDEATMAIDEAFAPKLSGATVYIYADDASMAAHAQNPEVHDETTVEEAAAATVVWPVDSDLLQARVDSHALATQALAIGRDDGGIPQRAAVQMMGEDIPIRISYNNTAIETLAASIDATIGNPRTDSSVSIEDGVATASEGHDGVEVDRDVLRTRIEQAVFDTPDGQQMAFVAKAEYSPQHVTYATAQATASRINDTIAPGATFSYNSESWSADASDLGSMITTTCVETDAGDYDFSASFDDANSKRVLLSHLGAQTADGGKIKVSMDSSGGAVLVHLDGQGTMPVVSQAIPGMNEALSAGVSLGNVSVSGEQIPSALSVDAALDYGVISVISSYTTEYTEGVVARNTNIHLAADLLNDSVVKADGGVWSFNGTAGECNEEKGFMAAKAIYNNEYVDEIGGGICQVATTVFNAVFDAGYPVVTRSNHSSYIASYPTGRDAAVSWPDLDLKWENDSSSDIVLRMSYTESSVTATLLGINPGYEVTDEVGEWEEGDKYKEITETDENYPQGTTFIKQYGTDGRRISVIRYVTDEQGKPLHEETFTSNYSAKNEITVKGTG